MVEHNCRRDEDPDLIRWRKNEQLVFYLHHIGFKIKLRIWGDMTS
jgi:hypothetical protein